MLSEAQPDHVTERLLERARLLSTVSDKERNYWRHVFDLARALGKLLHMARECMDSATLAYPIDAGTVHLWEQGLILPQEITSGDVTVVVRWYIDEMRKQRADALPRQLSTDAFSLFNELNDELTRDEPYWQQ